ncbi:HAD family hydrolase [Tabrizicola fusiformis]|uniref:HAD family hydrolase n=1 Tax=Tabrizicola sp. SY72 TaxID=2741673 RepID=UPI0015745919|nr:HAD family hydrolase [Tabrizicola sp. SY72]NTT87929.1 HAD family hydrolase [Tabrizicola sp. SY72]
MTEMIRNLSDIASRYDAVLCDLWGCLHNGKTPFPAAVAALRGFRAGGGKVVLLTNAPRPNSAIQRQLEAMGVPGDAWDLIVSSGDAAQAAMLSGAVGRKVFHIGAPKDEPFFTEFPGETGAYAASQPPIERVGMLEAEGIVCTGLTDDLTETPHDYRAQLLLGKTRGLVMLCANPDIVVDMGDKRLYCAGALAEDYRAMGGEALYYGKPHPPVYDLARRRLGLDDPRLLCIGDGISTDVQGGVAEGLDTLFITGGIATERFGDDPANPDPELLEAWLAQQQLSPTWAMPFLA